MSISKEHNTLVLRVHAKTCRNCVIEKDGYYELWVSSPAHNNQANIQVVELLSKHFNLAKSNIKIIKGHKSGLKIVTISR